MAELNLVFDTIHRNFRELCHPRTIDDKGNFRRFGCGKKFLFTDFATRGIVEKASTVSADFWDFLIMNKGSDRICGGDRNFDTIRSLFGYVNFGTDGYEERVPVEAAIGDLIVIRRGSNFGEERDNKGNTAEVRGNPEKFDGGMKELKGEVGVMFIGIVPFKKKGVSSPNNPGIENIEHFFMALKTHKEKIGADFIDSKVIPGPSFPHIASNGLQKDISGRQRRSNFDKQGEFRLHLILIVQAVGNLERLHGTSKINFRGRDNVILERRTRRVGGIWGVTTRVLKNSTHIGQREIW